MIVNEVLDRIKRTIDDNGVFVHEDVVNLKYLYDQSVLYCRGITSELEEMKREQITPKEPIRDITAKLLLDRIVKLEELVNFMNAPKFSSEYHKVER